DVPEAVLAGLAAGKPEDARQDPVAAWIARMELRRPDFAGGTTTDEHGVKGLPGADLRAHDVFTARRAETAVLLAEAILRRRDRPAHRSAPRTPSRRAPRARARAP